ncbi:MAG: mannose-6-phosphate isomerase, class I [Fusobacteriaceae bacterium]|nr:mannose-6-phosphate isomerase, class I [Fusobacteriaceae bacterium]MBN2838863.1 mannose-6-phosphate isomerase, class I [Fusobacteriaceae bacterium]
MYPLKFKKVFKEKIWGGNKFKTLLNMEIPKNKNIGESWEITCHKNGMSVVENGELSGKTLEELIYSYKDKLLGEEIYKKYGNKFPLLIKYLDVNDRLSVQVHPSDEYALRVEGEFGKSESWYIIDASEDAKLIMGLASGMSKEKFLEKVKNNNFDDLFNIISVKKGDFIYVEPGVVHASLEGSVVICETQQNSDTTYRIYDFDRIVDGEKRELHIDKAVEVIEFNKNPFISRENERKIIQNQNTKIQNLTRNEYFNIDKINVSGIYKDTTYKNFVILSILDGEGKIIFNNNKYKLEKGDTYFIPANLEVEFEGELEILKSFL